MTVRQVHSGGAESVIDHTRDFWKYSACLLIKEQEPVTRQLRYLIVSLQLHAAATLTSEHVVRYFLWISTLDV
jgi:hypothetical protein